MKVCVGEVCGVCLCRHSQPLTSSAAAGKEQCILKRTTVSLLSPSSASSSASTGSLRAPDHHLPVSYLIPDILVLVLDRLPGFDEKHDVAEFLFELAYFVLLLARGLFKRRNFRFPSIL